MGKKNKSKKAPKNAGKPSPKESERLSTFDAVQAMSSSDEGSVDKTFNAKAAALEKLIKGGAYDNILEQEKGDSDDESIEEVVLGDDSESEAGDQQEKVGDAASEEEESEEETKEKSGSEKAKEKSKKNSDEEDDEDSDSENDEESSDEKDESRDGLFDLNSKAIQTKTEELVAEKKGFPWVEQFDIMPSTALPFGTVDEETGMKIDVHDDLKREVAFYDIAMEAVAEAKTKCKENGIPFTRPDDFFAEMVKSDEHMARVKDRLIFENKKIEAVAQRKSNREQKLRSKEAHANKIAEKSRKKKENLKAVSDWAQSAAANRGGKYNDNDDQKYLKGLISSGQKRPWIDRDGNPQTGPNKKRMAANKKYGFGGKRGRFKQNSPQSMNDLSGYNPRGNFGGLGTKKAAGGSGGNRKGKRARDASRSRQRS